MSYLVNEGQTFEAVYESAVTGQAGTVAIRIDDNEGATVFGPTVVGISELGGTGVYVRVCTAPGVAGTQWSVIFSLDGTFDPETVSVEDLYVLSATGIEPVPPLVTIGGDFRAGGPCRAWTTVEEVAACCSTSSDLDELEEPLLAAVEALYVLGGKRHPGACEQTVRPCGNPSCCGPWGAWRGVGWTGSDFGPYGTWAASGSGGARCSCGCLDQIPLAGHAREIVEVLIDGDVVDASTYRLDEHRWLTRVPHPDDYETALTWPSCQDLALPDSEAGTFSIRYQFGMDPPVAGVLAARELACAIFATCAGGGAVADGSACVLPSGVTKIVRQGITIELHPFAAWGQTDGVWRTGMPLVDLYLNTYNPAGRRRNRATAWSPDTRKFPRPVG